MNDLTKQQLILLALLVSFVTSLATGIVTVSLMDQAPRSVSQTITQVIERTISGSPQNNAAASTDQISVEDQTTAAVSAIALGIVKIKDRNSSDIAGMGLVVSKSGVILADKATVAPLSNYDAVLPDGTKVPVSIVRSQIQGDIVFLAPSIPTSTEFSPVDFVSPQLGQTVFSLSGTSTPELGQGLVTRLPSGLPAMQGDDSNLIKTSIPAANVLPGSALFNIKGQVLGIKTSQGTLDVSEYYPVKSLVGVIPTIK